MNILVLGNGFDLAHGLPTGYKDFLRFTDAFVEYNQTGKIIPKKYEKKWDEEKETQLISYINDLFTRASADTDIQKLVDEISMLITDNNLIEHFKKINIAQGWIDFEGEIAKIIQVLDIVRIKTIKGIQQSGKGEKLTTHEQNVLSPFFGQASFFTSMEPLKKRKAQMLDDLNRLTRCLEIYLCDYVEKISIKGKLPDLDGLDIHAVVSFNYTDTYRANYVTDPKTVECDFIHGKAEISHDKDTCSMVIGIDEYLDGAVKENDNEYIQFKKFFQRIYKATGCDYVDWLEKIKPRPAERYCPDETNIYNVIYSYTDADGKRKQKWETYATKAEAKKRKKEIEYKEEMGSMIIPQCKTMKDLLAEYVALYGKDNWALSTYDGNVSLINNYILPIIGDEKLSEINTRFIEKYYQRLLKAPAVVNPIIGKRKNEYVSTSTIRDIHKLLRSCFKQAVKWELMEKNPCIYATVPKHKTKKREIWTAGTLMYALEVCEDDRLKLAMNLSFSCSLRISELLGLTWDCVDISEEAIEENRAYLFINKESQRVSKSALKELDAKDVLLIFPEKSKTNKTVRVLKTPKTDSSVRKVFLPKSVAKMLIEWKEKQDETKEVLGDEYMDYNLVMASTFGLPLGDGAIRKPLNQLIKDYDLPPVVFHSLRHSSVTYKLKLNGGDIKAVQGDSGHAQVSMVTDVYSHILDDDRKKNAELFEEAFYEKKDLDPQMHPNTAQNTVAVPEGVDAELLAKVLNNPEMAALLTSLAKTMK